MANSIIALRRGGLALLIAAGLCSVSRGAGIADRYDGLESDKYLGQVQVLAKVEDDKVFTEGPAVDADGRLLFTNVAASKILAWQPGEKKLSVFREDTAETNGLAFDARGRLLMCQGGAGKLSRLDLKTNKLDVLAEKYNGFPLAAPNDVCFDAAGRIYFSSRPGASDPAKGNVNAVYRLDTDGKLHQVLAWPKVHMPNGLDFSPDGKTLYLIEAHPDADHHRDIRAYDVDERGGLSNERVVIDFYPGRSGDGLCVDAEGNLYVAAGLHKTRGTSETLDTRPGIHVISPAGKLLAFRETPEDTVTNCCFGGADGRTLYVTCGSQLLAIPTTKPGLKRVGHR
jgi:gluconolactonase